MNVAHLFERTASRDAEAPAVALGRSILLTYGALAHRAARLAGALRGRLGLAAGDRVALLSANRAEYVEALLGGWWAGLAVVPVNAKLHPQELAFILGDSGARLALVSPELAPALGALAGTLPDLEQVIELGSGEYRRFLDADPRPMEATDGDAMAWLFYTSGTTGRPKGAMITHKNLRAMTYGYLIDVDEVGPRETILHAAPMSHGSGLYIVPHAAAGSCQVVPESGGFDEAEVFRLIEAHEDVHMFAAPTMVQRLVRHARGQEPDVSNLRTIVYGGAPMYLADLEAAHEAFGYRLAQLYGQGESPMCITALSRRQHRAAAEAGRRDRLQSVGTPQLVCELRIGDADGRPLPVGEAGEVMCRGDAVVPGYWRNPEATAATMGDGWLRTGDIGVLDGDGYLTLKDRSKDLVISGGANIYPREVEEALLAHPDVREVSVIGLADREWGERVVACVVAAPGTLSATLDAWCLERIARFKRPKEYVFLDALPKSSYGKILKRELRDRLARDRRAP